MFLPRPFLRYLRWWSAGLAQWCSCVWFGKPTRCIQLNASWRDWRVRRVLKRGCNPRPGHTSSEIAEVRTKAQPQTTWLSENLRNMESGGIRRNPADFLKPRQGFPTTKALLSAATGLSSVIVNRQSGEISNSTWDEVTQTLKPFAPSNLQAPIRNSQAFACLGSTGLGHVKCFWNSHSAQQVINTLKCWWQKWKCANKNVYFNFY